MTERLSKIGYGAAAGTLAAFALAGCGDTTPTVPGADRGSVWVTSANSSHKCLIDMRDTLTPTPLGYTVGYVEGVQTAAGTECAAGDFIPRGQVSAADIDALASLQQQWWTILAASREALSHMGTTQRLARSFAWVERAGERVFVPERGEPLGLFDGQNGRDFGPDICSIGVPSEGGRPTLLLDLGSVMYDGQWFDLERNETPDVALAGAACSLGDVLLVPVPPVAALS